jgi:excisionase family DNA binding protein
MGSSKEVLRPADLVPLLGVSRSRIYQMLREGSLPAIRQGRAIRIPRSAWERWLASQADRALASTRRGAGRKRGS